MKKILLLLITLLFSINIFSDTPEFLALDIASQGGVKLDNMDMENTNSFGVSYNFNSGVTAGFSFNKVGGNTISSVEVGVEAIEGAQITLLSGSDGLNYAFGVGLGYDFLTNRNKFFSSIGIYLDYIATSGTGIEAPYSLDKGGLFLIGLKTTLGL